MEEKQINKWLRRRFTGTGWMLVAYYVLMIVMVITAMYSDVIGQYLRAFRSGDFGFVPDTDALYGNAWGYIAAIMVGFAILHAWKGPDYWRSEVLVKEKPMSPGTLGCVLCLCVGAQMVNSIWVTILEVILNRFGLSAMEMLEKVSGTSDTVSMFLYSALLAPISEELLFRGYILRTLRPYGKRFAIFGSAFLFGLFHGNLLQTPYAFLVGLVLGYVTVEYSVLWAMVLHLFNNLVLADLLTRLTANMHEIPLAMLNLLIFGGAFVATIGILISHRREIKSYNHSEWMDRRCVKCFFTSPGVLVLTFLMAASMIFSLF